MDLRPPPENATIEELQKWNRDLYRFLEFPTFELLRLIPRSTAPSGFKGLSYFDESDSTIKIYNGTEYISLSPVYNYKNKIINGNFDFWQRGTSQTSAGYASDDRWFNIHSGSSKTHSRQSFTVGQTDVPGNPKYYSRTVVTSSAGASNYVIKLHRIESVYTLSGKPATLSFWAKADSTKNIAIEFVQYFGTGGSPSSIVTGIEVTTYALTSSWQKFTVTIDVPSISGKTIGSNGNDFFALYIWFEAGSDWDSRTNSLGQQSGTFDIAQIQLEENYSATKFDERHIGTEFDLCKRYFQKTYDLDVFPGTITQNGRRIAYLTNSSNLDHVIVTPWDLSVEMRGQPAVVFYSPITGTANRVRMTSGDVVISSTAIGKNNIQVWAINGSASTTRQLHFHATADAEL